MPVAELESGGVHDCYTLQCGLVGHFTSPGIDTRYKGPTAFSVSSEGHWQSGVNETYEAKFSAVEFEHGRDCPVARPSQRSNPLGYQIG